LRNPFRVLFFLSGRLPETIRPLAKPFSRFILHRAGRLQQLDHSWNPSHFFFLSGRSPETIRPLAKFFTFFYPRAGRPKQFDHLKKRITFHIIYFLISTSLCKGRMSIYCFRSFQDYKQKKKQKFVLYLLFFINLLRKAKRKQNFLISLHSKYYKKEATVIT